MRKIRLIGFWFCKLVLSVAFSSQVFAADTTSPMAPTGLTAQAISSSQINLSWTASTDDPSTGSGQVVGVAGYKVYRNGVLLATNPSPLTAYSDTGLLPITTYTYTVSAYDASGNESGQSGPVSATTPPLDSLPPLTGDVNCDKVVDILDVQALVNCILGTGDCDWGCGNSADVNGDDSIDILDVQEVVNIILVP